MSVKNLTSRSSLSPENINRAKEIVGDKKATKAQLTAALKFLDRANPAYRMATGPLSKLYPQIVKLQAQAQARLSSLVDGLEAATRSTRFVGVTAPTSVATELKATSVEDLKRFRADFNSNDTGMAIIRRDGKNFVWTAYQPVPRMRSRGMRAGASGVTTTVNSAGGLNLRAANGKDIKGAKAIFTTLDAVLPKKDARRGTLEKAGFDLQQEMNMMVIKAEGQKEPMIVIGGAGRLNPPPSGDGISGPQRMPIFPGLDRDQQGVTVICSDVQFLPFKDQNGNPTGGGTIVMRKPVVYLYPQTVQSVKVELQVDGQLTTTYPRIQKDHSWTIKAGPTGELFDPQTEKRYPYLFWEAQRNTPFTIDTAQAFCVASKDAEKFLEDAAGKYALNEKERTDFVTYWLPALENNKYSLVQFLSAQEYDRYASMNISPKPDCMNRMFMIFQGVNSPVKTGNPSLSQLDRKGFTVIEWGGTNLDEQR
jgi:hypothetical protein